ncbi:hypothetical protein VTI74DRAFT_66 [Chaetomium olivicolor]
MLFTGLRGFAGAGKSVLSSTIIQYTFRHRRGNPRIGIAFFYFTFNDESKQDTSAMLRALIQQLASQLKNQQGGPVSRLHQSCRGATPSNQAILDCFRQLVQNFDDVYIVLDALDESPRHKHREDLLQALQDIRGWSEPGLHLLVTSRDAQDIREKLKLPDEDIIPMNSSSIDEDIASYVSHHLKDRLQGWERFHDQIERALTEGAKGVFRWVECQFSALEACPRSKSRLDALLRSLPRNLYETYERMLSNIDKESEADAIRMLTLLCTARRPLTVEELIDSIAVELGDNPQFNEDSRLMNGADDIRRICPGFIELDLSPKNGGTTVRIAHYSVQEYLESDRIRSSATAQYAVDREHANNAVALICLIYLLHPGFRDAWLHPAFRDQM